MQAPYDVSAEFLPGDNGQLFTLNFTPRAVPAKGLVLYLPPLADEMHKARHTVAEQCRALAAAGYHVTILDLFGCGDSAGIFADASWQLWKADVKSILNLLSGRFDLPVTLWGLRLGGLLACDLSQEHSAVERVLLWQPALNGEQHLDQFLRFELAGQALTGRKKAFDRSGLWGELRSGRTLVVAGYELTSTLALEISRVRLADLEPKKPVIWFDIGAPALTQNPANEKVVGQWRGQGVTVDWQRIPGEAFWRSVNAGESPGLIKATVEALT